MRRRSLVSLLLPLLAACGGEPRPVPIVLNEDVCSTCRMAISQRELAAELVTVDGRVETFDDIGCLLDWLGEHGRTEGAGLFVVDFESGEWLAAEVAAYVENRTLPTPMGHGLVAFASPRAARAAVERLGGGAVLGWEELLERSPEPAP